MENMFLGVILLSVQVLTVSTAPIVPAQMYCAEGEPLVGETQPDVNLTVLPSLDIPVLSPLAIICDADVPRFPLVSNISLLQAPVRISIRIGVYEVKQCVDVTPVYQCVYDLTSFIPGIPQRVSCTAANELGQCRFKTANITLLPSPVVPTHYSTTRKQETNMTTEAPNTTTTTPPTENVTTTALPSSPPTPTDGNSTTRTPVVTTTEQVIPPIPTTTPTPKKKDDDSDDDDSDDDSDDESDSNSDSDSNDDSDNTYYN